jgi:hypothetical protein
MATPADDPRPAVGVTRATVEGAPRIVVAFFLDHPFIQITKDDSGRPIAAAAFEPKAAYETLVNKIIEAYDALKLEP